MRVFKNVFYPLGSEQAYSHWLHLFDFFPLCVFICVLKLPAPKDPKTHWLHLFWLISTVCLKMSPQMWFTERIQNHIGCICLIFLRCVFSNASSNQFCGRMQSHRSCTFVSNFSFFQDLDSSPCSINQLLSCTSYSKRWTIGVGLHDKKWKWNSPIYCCYPSTLNLIDPFKNLW